MKVWEESEGELGMEGQREAETELEGISTDIAKETARWARDVR